MNPNFRVYCSLVIALVATAPAFGQFGETILLYAPDGTTRAWPAAISADGTWVAGGAQGVGGGAFRWSRAGGFEFFGHISQYEGEYVALVKDISGDGQYVAGDNMLMYDGDTFIGGWSFRYHPQTGVEFLENVNYLTKWVGNNGRVITVQGMIWEAGAESLSNPLDSGAVPEGMSDDGTSIAYSNYPNSPGFRYTDDSPLFYYDDGSPCTTVCPDSPQPRAMSGNGEYVLLQKPTGWLLAGPTGMVPVPTYGPGGSSFISNDATRFADSGGVWMGTLNRFRIDALVLLPFPTCTITGMSSDGRWVCGTSRPGDWTTQHGFIARLPENFCAADIGMQGGLPGTDGLVDNNDFIVFISYFFAGHPRADVGAQGGVRSSDFNLDNNDFIVFISQFFEGC